MARKIEHAAVIKAAGNKPKVIHEIVGRVHTGTSELSLAKMVSPQGWVEPGQTPEFSEYSYVLKGALNVKTRDGELRIRAGEAVIVEKGEWVQYSTPEKDGAEYLAICLPAFSPDIVHRDA